MSREALDEAVAHAARSLPPVQISALADALAVCRDASHAVRRNVRAKVATAKFDATAQRVIDAWHDPSISGGAVALALRAAGETAIRERDAERIEVVCTGPSVPSAAARLTGVVIADAIREAHKQLLVVSFASYRVPAVITAIREVAARPAQVDIVLESAAESGGILSKDAGQAYADLGQGVRLWHWPAERRPKLPHGTAVLHAKCVVADRRVALVTSANLTGHGADHNIELGLLVRGGPVPGRIADVFGGLMDAGELALAQPRNVA